MPYTKPRDWVDGFDGRTPITAADLNRIEDGITATAVKADAAATATALAAVKTTADAAATATALAAVKTTADAALPKTTAASTYATTTALATAVPVGVVQMWAGVAAPAGWLLCQGQAVSRTTYAALYAVCGTAYGTGDGSSTFNLPDLRARMPIGLSGSGAFNALGNAGGEENHTLTTEEMPSHKHPVTAGTNMPTLGVWNTNMVAGDSWQSISSTTGNDGNRGIVTTSNTGGGGAHNNMPPYMVVNFIIRAS